MGTKVERAAPQTSGAVHAEPATAAAGGARDGVILLDLVLAVAILGFVLLVALASLPRGTTAARHAAYALEVAAVLKTDRTAAARTGHEVATRIDVAERTISGASGQVILLPDDLSLDVIASDICVAAPGRFAIAFAADGRSCGAVIRISKDTRAWRIRINWLTGFVDVVAPQTG
jgi:general secretion pathway protein H